MITCPNCNHQNPEGALQCEACYTPLPEMVACPSCNTPVQADASFCGQCGNDLRSLPEGESASNPSNLSATAGSFIGGSTQVSAIPESSFPTQNFLVEKEPDLAAPELAAPDLASPDLALPDLVAPDPLLVPEPMGSGDPAEASQPAAEAFVVPPMSATSETPEAPETPETPETPPPQAVNVATQLQTLSARLRHVQTDTLIEIPRQLSVVRIGKPNDQTPPDVDVSGFPDSEVVSRVHANLRVEGDAHYFEDVGSSNGTYINGLPLAAGNRHRLRQGDRIALGKGDKVSFIFETA
jgi:hypothetical protein